ncbi:MAG: RNA polymerase factor sigma-54 [Lachnospiraceae bacterium]|nr:RNA polymerase factor sigma-54 [Lachnospiraceae bacterium]
MFDQGMTLLNNGLYQRQNVTTQLVQDMSVLQMSAIELENYLEKLSLENPVIELEEDEKQSSQEQMDFFRKQEWLAAGDRQNKTYYDSDGDEDSPENYWKDTKNQESLASYLRDQVLLAPYNHIEREIVNYLILSLDGRGYCQEDLGEIARYYDVPEGKVELLLKDIQSMEPAGVGARNLEECLELQLDRINPHADITRKIIREHLTDLAKNHLQDIARKLQVPLSTVTASCEEIRTLNPKPGNAFANNESLKYVTPDALVIQRGDHFEVIVNEYQYPSFKISDYYQHLEQTTDDRQVKEYLKEKIQQANNVAGSIAMRTSNLTKLLEFLVVRQEDFFRYGPGHKKPLKLSDIAMEFQMHESTVSRTLRSKYLQCSWGVFPLRYFLSGISNISQSGAMPQTQDKVKSMITGIIASENKKKPYSDEAIRNILIEKFNIDISRRTVNKYRQEMNIPDKSGRKDWSL